MGFFGWIDHDPEHERKVLRALAAEKAQDARDELGLGAIRDTFSDLFFPGTSTIHTRLRYFLFVQWCCEAAASRGGDVEAVLSSLRGAEVALIGTLTSLGPQQGVIGLQRQGKLERMPSEIYWSGLGTLGLRMTPGSIRRWAARTSVRADAFEHARPEDGFDEGRFWGFDSSRPPPPPGFPSTGGLSFTLNSDEAAFLRDRLRQACVSVGGVGLEHNLFDAFSGSRRKTRVAEPWSHPAAKNLGRETRGLLDLARAFANVAESAYLVYNLVLAKLTGSAADERAAACRARLADCCLSFGPDDASLVEREIDEVVRWGLATHHTIDGAALAFVKAWARLCRAPARLLSDGSAEALVKRREVFMKAASGTSRVASKAALARWTGASGGRYDYRWRIARSFLNDLAVD